MYGYGDHAEPRDVLDIESVKYRAMDGSLRDVLVEDWATQGTDLSRVLPVRDVQVYKNMKHKPGLLLWDRGGQQVLCESRLEMLVGLMLRQEQRYDAAAGQPATITYLDRATECRFRHTPDLALREPNGHITLIDVSTAATAEDPDRARDFVAARLTARLLGMSYRLITEPSPAVTANVLLLAARRRPHPGVSEQRDPLLASAVEPRPLADVVADAARRTGAPEMLLMATALHLIWARDLLIHPDDVEQVLHRYTTVFTNLRASA